MLYHLTNGVMVPLQAPFKAESIAIIRSSKLGFSSNQGLTGLSLIGANNNVHLRVGFRPREDVVVLNHAKDGFWGTVEEKLPLTGKFKNANPTITICDHGDRFQVLLDNVSVTYFKKRIEGDVIAISYDYAEQEHGFSDILTLDVLSSFSELI
jgi:Galactoside-binding lectin